MVADALSRKSSPDNTLMTLVQKPLLLELQKLKVKVVPVGLIDKLFAMTIEPTLLERIKQSQIIDSYLVGVKDEVESKKKIDFEVSTMGVITFKGRLCVPEIDNLRKEILTEAHSTPYSVHPGTTKMYKDLKMHY